VSSLLKLINEFSARETVPVEVDHIEEYLRATGIKDEIYFFEEETNFLKGTIVHWEYVTQGWTRKVVDIYTEKSLPPEEKRLVQAKELLHILDSRIDRASTLEDVERLTEEMAAHPSEQDGYHTNSDRHAILHVLPVLFPMAVRALFLPLYEQGKIDVDFIADEVALPKLTVRFVMSELWAAYHKTMMAVLKAEIPKPDRVHTIDSNQTTMEVYSVPLEDDPYYYAKRLEEHIRGTKMAATAFIVETRRGRRNFSASELAAYTPWSKLKG
jgi:hypothetical protein